MNRLVVRIKAIKYKKIPFAIYFPKLFHQIKSLGLVFLLLLDLSSGFTQWVMPLSFPRLYSIGHTIEFCYNSNAVHCQNLGYKIYQSNQIELPLY